MKTLENYNFLLQETSTSSSDDYDNIKGVICEICDSAEKTIRGNSVPMLILAFPLSKPNTYASVGILDNSVEFAVISNNKFFQKYSIDAFSIFNDQSSCKIFKKRCEGLIEMFLSKKYSQDQLTKQSIVDLWKQHKLQQSETQNLLPNTNEDVYQIDSQMQKEMTGAYLQACDSFSHDITRLYLKLEHIFDKYHKQGLAKEGEDFIFDIGIDITIRLKFYKGATEVYVDNSRNETIKEGLIISKEQSRKREYTPLTKWGELMSTTNTAIGKLPPYEFQDMLAGMKPGTILSFTEGKSYVCRKAEGGGLVFFREVYDGDIKNLNIANFCMREDIVTNTRTLIGLQRFYQQNKKSLTQTTEADYSTMTSVHLQIEDLEKDITPFRSKKVQLGPVSLIVKKSFSGKLRWYGADGKQIDKEKVAYLIGVLNTQPIITTYNRQAPTELKTAEDAEFRLSIEKLLDAKEYRTAYRDMLEYSLKHTDDLVINTDGLLRDGDNYIAGTLTFRNGQAYKTTYENNDFSTIKESTPLTEDEFNSLCERKYTDTFQRVYSDTMEEIRSRYEAKSEKVRDLQEKIARTAAEEQMKKQSGIIVSESELKEGVSEHADLLDNLSDQVDYSSFFRG